MWTERMHRFQVGVRVETTHLRQLVMDKSREAEALLEHEEPNRKAIMLSLWNTIGRETRNFLDWLREDIQSVKEEENAR